MEMNLSGKSDSFILLHVFLSFDFENEVTGHSKNGKNESPVGLHYDVFSNFLFTWTLFLKY